MKTRLLAILTLISLPLAASAATSTWEVDQAHSAIGFKVRHMLVSNVRGSFKEFKGTLTVDDKDATKTTAEVTINPATIDTAEPKRDEHLKSGDFFDVAQFKEIAFKTTKVAKKGKGLKLTGNLTMHGVTKEVTFDVEELTAPQKAFSGKMIRGLSATGTLNRKDFGMTWNKTLDKGGLAVSEKVDVNIELELVEKSAETKKPEEKKS